MAELFTLRCSTYTVETKIESWVLNPHEDEAEMACKIYRMDNRGRWHEIDFGEMFFFARHPNQYNQPHLGKYIDGWWRARVPLHEAQSGIEYWPHELNEGSKQYVNSYLVEFKSLPFKPEPEGVVTVFGILGDEHDRPIEEVKAELKSLVEGATEAEQEIVISRIPLHAGSANTPSQEFTEEPLEAVTQQAIGEAAILDAGGVIEAEPEQKTALTRGKVKAIEKRKAILTCPICGATTTKSGKPFKSELSLKRHVSASHKTRDTKPPNR